MRIFIAVATILLCSACPEPETNITVGVPDLEEPPSVINFGEVHVESGVTATWTLNNEGLGDLNISNVSYIGDADIKIQSYDEVVEGNDTGSVTMTYQPSNEQGHSGVLTLETDDPDYEVLVVPVSGVGVLATLDISPENLWFGEVTVGDSYKQTTTMSSIGSGSVTIDSFEFTNPEATSGFTLRLPEDAGLPLTLEPGHALSLEVTYLPLKETDYTTEVIVVSNDNESPYLPIMLYTGKVEGGDEPPMVEILEPEWGTRWMQDESLPIEAQAIDPDNAPETLTVTVFIDGLPVGGGAPDATGAVQWWTGTGSVMDYPLTLISEGAHTLKLIATDPDGHTASDEVGFSVDPSEVQIFTLTGGESIFEYISVDDDLLIEVNGDTLYIDDNGTTDAPVAPIEFEGAKGDRIHIVATDANACRKEISDIWIHYGTNNSQQLVEGVRVTSCPGDVGDPDYDETYTGPWPNDFLDVEVEVAIP